MSDTKMPEPSGEWLFEDRHKPYPKMTAVQVNNFSTRLRQAGTIKTLEVIRRDILRSALVSNMQAIRELQGIGNTRAEELKYKNPKGEAWWS